MDTNYLNERIRKVPDFPKKGILFYDITTLFEDKEAFRKIIDEICDKYKDQIVDKVVGVDARGFLLASAVAYKLNAGLAIVRKKGKLPYTTKEVSYEKEYGTDIIQIHDDTIKSGEKVLIVDDLLATGGTMLATVELIEQMKGDIIGIEFIINLSFLAGLKKLKQKNYPLAYMINYDK